MNAGTQQTDTQHPNHDSIKLCNDRHKLFPLFFLAGQEGRVREGPAHCPT